MSHAVKLLGRTPKEEEATDGLLTRLAEDQIDPRAVVPAEAVPTPRSKKRAAR